MNLIFSLFQTGILHATAGRKIKFITRCFKLENWKNQVQIDRGMAYCSLINCWYKRGKNVCCPIIRLSAWLSKKDFDQNFVSMKYNKKWTTLSLKSSCCIFFFFAFLLLSFFQNWQKRAGGRKICCAQSFTTSFRKKRNKISFSVTFACEYHVVACLSIDHPLKLYIEKRVEQENSITEFNNCTIIKLGRINYRIRINSENGLVITKWPATQELQSEPKFLVTADAYLSATLSPNNLDIFHPCLQCVFIVRNSWIVQSMILLLVANQLIG